MSLEKTVLYKKVGAVAIITLNRPQRYNAVTPQLNENLNVELRKARNDNNIRAVVLTGSGKGFCAGADMDGFSSGRTPEDSREYITTTYQSVMRNILTLPKPVIGAINGTAAGVGASIALACDLRVMAENSSILYAFINIGLGPDGGGAWWLARQVGYSRAFQIAVEGKKILADRCLELGLTNKVVKSENFMEETLSWAQTLAERPTLAIGITKQDLQFAMNNNLYDTIAFEAEQQVKAFNSYDLKEGVAAFLEKRSANFLGK